MSEARISNFSKDYDLAILKLENPYPKKFAIDSKNIAEPNTGVKKKGPPPATSEDNDELDSQQLPSGPEQDLTQVQKEINILTAMNNLAKESNDETTFQQLTKDIDVLKKKRSKLRKMVGDD